MKQVSSIIFVILLATSINAFKWERCDLARTLVGFHSPFYRQNIDEWMCLIQYESSFNQSAIGGPNTNGSFDWGLFQVNDNYWCLAEQPGLGNDCNMPCTNLLNGDIYDDLTCVKKIYERHGFTAWHGWTNRCRDHPENFVNHDHCFTEMNEV